MLVRLPLGTLAQRLLLIRTIAVAAAHKDPENWNVDSEDYWSYFVIFNCADNSVEE